MWTWWLACGGLEKLTTGGSSPESAPSTAAETDADTDADADTDGDPVEDSADSGTTAATTPPFTDCRTPTWNVPPTALPGWTDALSKSGADTLTWDPSHSHDDGFGAIGYCPAAVAPGDVYLKLVSARFETDQTPPDLGCPVDPAAPDAEMAAYGMCGSGGKHNVYVEVLDSLGERVSAGFTAVWDGGYSAVVDQGKPADEFPMNFPLYGGGRYAVEADWLGLPSDWVSNLRLPGNHHVDYLLTFQETTR